MAVAKNLEVIHDVKVLAEDIGDKVQAIDRVDQNVKLVKERTQSFRLSSHKLHDTISYFRVLK